MGEQHTELTSTTAQVTRIYVNWASHGTFQPGTFSFQAILDNGGAALILPTLDDAKLLRDLIQDADTVTWDSDQEVLGFKKIL